MYCPDVISLKQFYASSTGQVAHGLLWKQLRRLWPEAKGETTLGLGFAAPYLSSNGSANVSVVCMPAFQGALYWPPSVQNRVALAHEYQLPFADESFNRIIVVHTLEHSNHVTQLMQELWRVVVPGGRIVTLTPNRLGLWSRGRENPFAHGRPYSLWQMRQALSEGGFTFLRGASSLFIPPVAWRWMLACATVAEYIGQLFFPLLGGVLLVEAEKQVYAAVPEPVRARMSPVPVPTYSIVSSTMDGVSS